MKVRMTQNEIKAIQEVILACGFDTLADEYEAQPDNRMRIAKMIGGYIEKNLKDNKRAKNFIRMERLARLGR